VFDDYQDGSENRKDEDFRTGRPGREVEKLDYLNEDESHGRKE
jgi:hypothetical protein